MVKGMVYICPKCVRMTIECFEHYVCPECGLVVAPIFDDADITAPDTMWLLFELAFSFELDFTEVYRLYRKFRACRVRRPAAAVAAIYVLLRERGEHLPVERLCKLLKSYGFNVKLRDVKRAILRASPYIGRPSPKALIKLYAGKLNLDSSIVERAEKILSGARFLGGRDPHLVALAALYLAAEGKLTYYRLAKLTGRSPSRIRDNVLHLVERLR